jgi:soluble lytic murein transglycosylase-like protein
LRKALPGLIFWLVLSQPAAPVPRIDPPAARLDSVILAIEGGKFGDALAQLATLPPATLTPQDRNRARYLAAHAAMKLKRYAEAVQAFGEVFEHYPELADYAVWNMARIYQELNAERFYEETLRRLIVRFPESRLIPQARMALARYMVNVTGELRDAVGVLEELLAQQAKAPYAPEAYLLLGQAYAGLGLHDKAVEVYRSVYVRFPTTPEAEGVASRMEALLPQGQRFLTWLTPHERLQRADQLAEAGDCERAIQEVHQIAAEALSADLGVWATSRLGICGFKLRRYRDTIAALEKMRPSLLADERAPEALYILGSAYQRDGRSGEAERTFRLLAAREPQTLWNAKALVALGSLYEGRQEMERAVEAYRELTARYPTADRADEFAWRIGWLHYIQGLFSGAARDFAAAAEHYPRSMFASNALYWQAKALEKSGSSSQAMALYEQVARDYPYTYYGIRAQEVSRTKPSVRSAAANPMLAASALASSDGAWRQLDAEPVLSSAAQFHRVRMDELLALRFGEDAREEVSQLAKCLGGGGAEQVFLARSYMKAAMSLQAIRILNDFLSAVAPRERLSLPLDFWTMFFPQLFWAEVQEAAKQAQLDPLFLLGVIRQESAFNARAVSRSDARGLMQLLPSTGREVFQRLGMDAFRAELLFEPSLNVRIGAHYLGRLAEAHRGNLILALAAYNAGPARVKRWLQEMSTADWDEFIERLPLEETRGYVKNVLRNYGVYQRLYVLALDGQAAH